MLDKPWLAHAVERLVHCGATALSVATEAPPPEIVEFLGDGSRWGLPVHFGFSAEGPEPQAILADIRALPTGRDGALSLQDQAAPWRICPAAEAWDLARQEASQPIDQEGLSTLPPASRFLALNTWSEYFFANHPRFLHLVPEALIPGREVEPGVILCRNVELHPSARVVPPVFLGEDVRIGRNATIGPDAVVHRASIVSEHSEVVGATVLPHTFVGEDLDLREMIALPNRLWSVEMQIEVPISDAFIIGDLRRGGGRVSALGQAVAKAWQALGLRRAG